MKPNTENSRLIFVVYCVRFLNNYFTKDSRYHGRWWCLSTRADMICAPQMQLNRSLQKTLFTISTSYKSNAIFRRYVALRPEDIEDK